MASMNVGLTVISVDREALLDIPNVYNYQAFVETEKAGYIIRQWVASSLYDRIRYVQTTSFALGQAKGALLAHDHSSVW